MMQDLFIVILSVMNILLLSWVIWMRADDNSAELRATYWEECHQKRMKELDRCREVFGHDLHADDLVIGNIEKEEHYYGNKSVVTTVTIEYYTEVEHDGE